ncbi:hypothetical protein NDU88_001566 [Pleurodeles waltl]|uniref:Uncharacterized protein n=1 Tax=Pleurodeles waltl TaxID=8319 RepID=A0AAV7MK40_PLEWA|nr:hypothetical protein NDU88_001566 [Pleurodeles waltl]
MGRADADALPGSSCPLCRLQWGRGVNSPNQPPVTPATRSVASRQPRPPEKAAIGPLQKRRSRLSDQAQPRAPTDPELQLRVKSGRDPLASSGHCHSLLRGVHCRLAPRIPVGFNRDGRACPTGHLVWPHPPGK